MEDMILHSVAAMIVFCLRYRWCGAFSVSGHKTDDTDDSSTRGMYYLPTGR